MTKHTELKRATRVDAPPRLAPGRRGLSAATAILFNSAGRFSSVFSTRTNAVPGQIENGRMVCDATVTDEGDEHPREHPGPNGRATKDPKSADKRMIAERSETGVFTPPAFQPPTLMSWSPEPMIVRGRSMSPLL